VIDHLCAGCAQHFDAVRGHLHDLEVPFSVNPRMVRGLDYYTKTTFEMVTDRLGAQSAVAAGGRYDRLVADLGGPALPGIGFAMGEERLALLLADGIAAPPGLQVFIATLGEEAEAFGFRLLTRLQRRGIYAEMEYAGKSLKAQLRRADKLGARQVLILGGDELARGVAQLRDMAAGTQEEVALTELDARLGLMA
jgi:histidyl-tRNA synthetase